MRYHNTDIDIFTSDPDPLTSNSQYEEAKKYWEADFKRQFHNLPKRKQLFVESFMSPFDFNDIQSSLMNSRVSSVGRRDPTRERFTVERGAYRDSGFRSRRFF